MSNIIDSNWISIPASELKIEPNKTWNLMQYMDVSARITHKMVRVGKQVGEDTGRYRYFIEQGDEGERTYGEWHDE